jgi:hypothetical protein
VSSWDDFELRVASVLSGIVDGGRLIISATNPAGVYVQAGQEDGDLVIEAVADRYLPPESRVGAVGAAQLRALGWGDSQEEWENWTYHIGWPALTSEYRKGAEMLVGALRDVFGVPDPGFLAYRAWNDRLAAPEQDLPELGIARTPN